MRSNINSFLTGENSNAKYFLKKIPNEKNFINLILKQYQSFIDSFTSDVPESKLVELNLFWITNRGFCIAIELLLQGHISEAYAIVSKSAEASGYALKIHNSPEKAEVWVKKGDLDKKDFSDQFGEPFQRDMYVEFPQLKLLYQIYELTREYGTHSNLASVIFHVERNIQDNGKTHYRFKTSELENPKLVQANINYIIHSYLLMLNIFNICFSQIINKRWSRKLSQLDSLFDNYRPSTPDMLNALGFVK